MKNKKYHCTAILLSGGSGKRMGSSVAKQYLEIDGKPILFYSLDVLEKSQYIDDVVLVIRPEDEEYVKKDILDEYSITKVRKIAHAGAERYESVWNGLNEVDKGSDYVFIHDGARPLLSEEIIRRNYETVIEKSACVTAVPSKDTVKIVSEDGIIETTPSRDRVWLVQTPQTFSMQLIFEAYKKATSSGETYFTDDAMMVEKFTDKKVYVVKGDYTNIKVTTPDDLLLAEGYLRGRD